MELDHERWYDALRSHDPRFDGRLFIAVITTRIYCRPICPAKRPLRKNVRIYACAAAAEAAGFRPCLRCRPEVAPWTSAWNGTSATVSRALRLIGEGALDSGSVDGLAGRLGVTSRHMRRLFEEHLGASPIAIAQSRRVHFARTLLTDTSLPISDVAFAAGFASVRRFNTAIQTAYRMAPRAMRRGKVADGGDIVVRLPYRPPFDFAGLLSFLRARAIPGVEAVEGEEYRRTIAVAGARGVIRVRNGEGMLLLSVPRAFTQTLKPVVDRVRRLFDLFADPDTIGEDLARGGLGELVCRWPGARVPGAWDPFELAVRAVVGQQVSVAAATTLMGRIAARYGTPLETGDPALRLVFPDAAALRNAPIDGMPSSRAETIRALAAADLEQLTDLTAIRGVGPWTASYIAMRRGDPDAFPQGDLVLRKAAGNISERELLARAEAWRPWRAYAAILLWRSS
ncbi:MAG: AraC family transcriptional regulator [Acidobacteria bacterium]|nr:AraC family transcriptional regulator [Acidobacteriota bacterium]